MRRTRRVGVARASRISCGFIFISLSLALTNCGNEDDSVVKDQRQVYLSESYGYVAVFDEELHEAKGYAVVDGSCWEQPIPQEIWWASARDEDSMEFDYLGQKQPPMPFVRVLQFEDACPQGTLKTALDADFEIDFQLEYELFQRTFAQHYAFFELREVDWATQVKKGENALENASSAEDFFNILVDSVGPLKDGHIVVQAGEELVFTANERPDIVTSMINEALAEGSDSQESVDAYVEAQLTAMGVALESYLLKDSKHGSIEEPIFTAIVESGDARYGYFRISTFAEIVEGSVQDNVTALDDAIENAFDDWGKIDGVILDVRINDGGWDVLGRALVGHFIEEETHVYSKRVRLNDEWSALKRISVSPAKGARYHGPVALLTSATTVSAAETFAMAMSSLNQVTLVGENTHGVLSDSLPKFLPSGIFFSLSNEEYQTPQGEVFERVGIPADIPVEVFAKADREKGRDSSIEAALRVLESATE